MDVPESTPPWPSASGPKVTDLDTKLRKTEKLDMDSALACLRRELVSIFCCYFTRFHFPASYHTLGKINITYFDRDELIVSRRLR